MDVLRQVLNSAYTAGTPKPKETLVQYAERVQFLDARFRLDCVEQLFALAHHRTNAVYAMGVAIARIVHEHVNQGKIGADYLKRWEGFAYVVRVVYGIDLNVYPLPLYRRNDK